MDYKSQNQLMEIRSKVLSECRWFLLQYNDDGNKVNLSEKLLHAKYYAKWFPFISSFNSSHFLRKKVQLLS